MLRCALTKVTIKTTIETWINNALRNIIGRKRDRFCTGGRMFRVSKIPRARIRGAPKRSSRNLPRIHDSPERDRARYLPSRVRKSADPPGVPGGAPRRNRRSLSNGSARGRDGSAAGAAAIGSRRARAPSYTRARCGICRAAVQFRYSRAAVVRGREIGRARSCFSPLFRFRGRSETRYETRALRAGSRPFDDSESRVRSSENNRRAFRIVRGGSVAVVTLSILQNDTNHFLLSLSLSLSFSLSPSVLPFWTLGYTGCAREGSHNGHRRKCDRTAARRESTSILGAETADTESKYAN